MKYLIISLFYNVLLMFHSLKAEDDIESASIELSLIDFDSHIASKSHLVMFYAPWCGHCKRLHPTWEKYAATQNIDSDLVAVSKVDCTKHTSLCAKHEVNGYPTIKLFKKGSETGIKYKGPRDIDSFNAFIREEFNITVKSDETEPISGLIEHTEETFAEKAKTGLHFVKFYAPWCGHCQRLAPTWEALGKEFQKNADISIGKVDCTKFKSLCTEYEVRSYPTLLWLSDGQSVSKYSGDRSFEGLSAFVRDNMKSGAAGIQSSGAVHSSVINLTHENFDTVVSSGFTMVKFFAPWCGHCKRLAPTYEELGKKFENNDAIKIARLDCTHDNSREYCNKQSVNGFPSLFLYRDGNKIGEYEGDRGLENLVNYIKKHSSHDEL